MLAIDSIVAAAPDQVSADLDGEAAILNLQSGVYYGLNPVGAEIWALIQQPTSVGAVCDALQEKFEVARDQCEAEVLALLGDLREAGLIEVRDAAPA